MGFIDGILNKFFGKKSDRDVKRILPLVEKINQEYVLLESLSNDELRSKTDELKQKIQDFIKPENDEILHLKKSAETIALDKAEEIYDAIDKLEKQVDEKLEQILLEILPQAFAIMKDTARRFKTNDTIIVTANEFDKNLAITADHINIVNDKAIYSNSWMAGGNKIIWDMVHYDVQLIGGVVLHEGSIAEMATGEGKTLVATLPVFLNALTRRGVHIVTVNDYLAKRDSEWMGVLYQFHGLSVDCIDKHQPHSNNRRKAYLADITFGTNNEFGFDYLRDNMALTPEELVQRRHNYTIVDEVDSVLIDDARTPLIISGPVPKGDEQLFDQMKGKVEKLVAAQRHFVSQELITAKELIQKGEKQKGGFHLVRAYKGLPKNKALIKYLSETGNKSLLHETENTYLAENAKRMPEVTDELFFVIDEKNNSIELTDKGIDLITGTTDDVNFYILPDIGSEIAEIERNTANEEEKLLAKERLNADYAIKSERLHTINQLLKAYTLFEKDVEYVVMENKVKIVDEQTGRILDGRRYSDGLHQAIEAKENVKIEAATQTFATITLQNYFRMYHKLAGMTGTAETEAGELWDIYKLDVVVIPTNRPITRKDREDLVYRTKREKYNAVIDEITNLVSNGRPVLVGTTSVEVSELLSKMLSLRNIKHNVLNAKLHQREADIVAEAGKTGTVTIATNMAGRGTDIKLAPEVKACGGLAIIGTERHESRRVDRQLRGRAGRQGDPGSSQFFVSLEDTLMRLFGSDRISKIMDRLGLDEGEVIQHKMISNSIERAQKKVEENNFGIRKRLLEYDDVMNAQREVVYKRRRHALFGERLEVDLANMMYDTCESIVSENHGETDFEEFQMALLTNLAMSSPVSTDSYIKMKPQDIVEKLYDAVIKQHERRIAVISMEAMPVIKQVYENQGHKFTNIIVPITDGKRVYNAMVNLEDAYKSEGKLMLKAYEKTIVLRTIDEAWKEHLREMDELKRSVQNASYEQKDPLLIYKLESYNLFKTMIDTINKKVLSTLMKGRLYTQDPNQVREAPTSTAKQDYSKYKTQKNEIESIENQQRAAAAASGQQEQKKEPIRVQRTARPNDPCPCGSGKKYKKCHGASQMVN